MKSGPIGKVRCAVYTRVSTDQGLDQDFNSLDAQYEASSAYIKSQAHAGWTLIRSRYDDGGYSGGSTDRPNLQRLLEDVRAHKIDVIVVYKVDRLTRSLADFAKLVELFEAHGVSFVSVTQQFNTTTSMGRLTLNVLLSFAQFEREVTSECRYLAEFCTNPFGGLENIKVYVTMTESSASWLQRDLRRIRLS
jgi:site-specific DNA recombinase